MPCAPRQHPIRLRATQHPKNPQIGTSRGQCRQPWRPISTNSACILTFPSPTRKITTYSVPIPGRNREGFPTQISQLNFSGQSVPVPSAESVPSTPRPIPACLISAESIQPAQSLPSHASPGPALTASPSRPPLTSPSRTTPLERAGCSQPKSHSTVTPHHHQKKSAARHASLVTASATTRSLT